MTLSTGKTLSFLRRPGQAAFIEQELTEDEWEEYCATIKQAKKQEQWALNRMKAAVLRADARAVQWWSAAANRARLRMY